MSKSPVDTVVDTFLDALYKISQDESLSSNERQRRFEEKRKIFHEFVEKEGFDVRGPQKDPNSAEAQAKRRLEETFEEIRAENRKRPDYDPKTDPASLNNLAHYSPSNHRTPLELRLCLYEGQYARQRMVEWKEFGTRIRFEY